MNSLVPTNTLHRWAAANNECISSSRSSKGPLAICNETRSQDNRVNHRRQIRSLLTKQSNCTKSFLGWSGYSGMESRFCRQACSFDCRLWGQSGYWLRGSPRFENSSRRRREWQDICVTLAQGPSLIHDKSYWWWIDTLRFIFWMKPLLHTMPGLVPGSDSKLFCPIYTGQLFGKDTAGLSLEPIDG